VRPVPPPGELQDKCSPPNCLIVAIHSQEEIAMSESDFQTTVLAQLADLRAEQAETKIEVKAVVARLDKVNGNISRHEKELREHDLHIAARSATVRWLIIWRLGCAR
jgi:hypothetical protein